MRRALPLVFVSALAACVTARGREPIVFEEAVVGTRGDGAFVLVEWREPAEDPVRAVLVAPDGTHTDLGPLDLAASLPSLRADASRRAPTALRALAMASPALHGLLAAAGAEVAQALAPVPGTERLRWSLGTQALQLWVEPARDGIGGAQVVSVRAGDRAGTSVEVASSAATGGAWVVDAYRAGERVAIVVGSLDRDDVLRRVQSTLFVALPRARAQVLARRGIERYTAGDLDAAAVELQRSVEADAGWAEARYDLACVKALQGAMKDARRLLEEAFRLDPIRVRDLAARDRDLADVRALPGLREALGLPAGPPVAAD